MGDSKTGVFAFSESVLPLKMLTSNRTDQGARTDCITGLRLFKSRSGWFRGGAPHAQRVRSPKGALYYIGVCECTARPISGSPDGAFSARSGALTLSRF